MTYNDHFSIANIPYGIASDASHANSVVTRLEDKIFFLSDLSLDYTEDMKAAVSQVSHSGRTSEQSMANRRAADPQRVSCKG